MTHIELLAQRKLLEKSCFTKKCWGFFTLNYSFQLLLNDLGLSNVQFSTVYFYVPQWKTLK